MRTKVYTPRVEAGWNTSTVIPVSRKRRQKKNSVSDETVMYGYEPSTTLATDRFHYKLQTCPLVRKGAPRRRARQLSGKRKKKNLIMGPKGVSDTKTDRRLTVGHNINSTQIIPQTILADREEK
jgi:hypothetical protein